MWTMLISQNTTRLFQQFNILTRNCHLLQNTKRLFKPILPYGIPQLWMDCGRFQHSVCAAQILVQCSFWYIFVSACLSVGWLMQWNRETVFYYMAVGAESTTCMKTRNRSKWMIENKIQKSYTTQIIYSTFITAIFHLYYLYTKTTSIQRCDAVTTIQIPD